MNKWLSLAAAVSIGVASSSAHAAACLTEADVDAMLGSAIRANALFLDTSAVPNRPLCSGLTLAQQIQRIRDKAFPQEVVDRNAVAAQLVAREPERPNPPPAEQRPQVRPAVASGPAAIVLVTTASTGLSLDELLDRVVAADAQSWMMNRYASGSMRGAHYVSGNKAKTSYVARGTYRFSGFGGGGEGWVQVRVAQGRVECLEFWDQSGVCRAPGHSLSQQTMLSMASGMLSGGGGGSSSSGPSDTDIADDINRRNQDRANASPPPPAPAPMTPIGGAGGLYGCASPPCM